MKFSRHFTKKNGGNPFKYVEWTKDNIESTNYATGEIIFKLNDVEVPKHFNKLSREIIVTRYFRMSEVPTELVKVDEVNRRGKVVPEWLRRSEPTEVVKNLRDDLNRLKSEENRLRCNYDSNDIKSELDEIIENIKFIKDELNNYYTHESSAKQVFHRLAGFWAYWGWMNNYFTAESDARAFYEESVYMLCNQIAAPNTPQWFSSGLYWAYGIEGESKGLWRYNPDSKRSEVTDTFYKYPGVHGCHIINSSDSLFDDGGIYDDLVIEAKAFAIGGGVGKSTSNIRSKYEFLRTGNKASGSMEFALVDDRSAGVIKSGSSMRKAAKMVVKDMDDPEVPEFIEWKAQEEKKVEALLAGGYSINEAYRTVSGQNSNNSIRISDEFINKLIVDGDWEMTSRTDGSVVRKMKARKLWESIIKSTWQSGDPGVQYDSTIQAWDTCPKDGKIRASNPCGEYLFKDNTSCNLASINLQQLFDGPTLRIDDFIYVCRHWLTVLDISVDVAQLPSKQLATGTAMYRTTGLGHTGLGAVLQRAGIAYDSDEACHLAAAVSSLMTAQSYIMSAKLAQKLGTFPRFKENKQDMLKVISNHRAASVGEESECSVSNAWMINHSAISKELSSAIIASWDKVIKMGSRSGFRNAFVTLEQPSGCITTDSLISTSDGLLSIGSIGDYGGRDDKQWQDIQLNVGTDDGMECANKFFVNGPAETIKITTGRGFSIEGTHNHRIRVLDENGYVWKRLDEIEENDLVAIKRGNRAALREIKMLLPHTQHRSASNVNLPKSLDKKFAELLGYYMGDGYLRADESHFGFCVCPDDTDLIEYIESYVGNELGLHTWREQHNSIVIKCCSAQLARYMKINDLVKHGAADAFIPEAVLRSPNCVRAAFLRGLFEADGGIPKCHGSAHSVAFSTISHRLAKQVQCLLLDLNIISNIRPMPFDDRRFGTSLLYEVRLANREQVLMFRETIGFISDRKKSLLLGFEDKGDSNRGINIPASLPIVTEIYDHIKGHKLRAGFRSRMRGGTINLSYIKTICEKCNIDILFYRLISNGVFFDRVDDISHGYSFTVDISVPKNNTYIANGFVSHNTVGLVMGCDTTSVEPDFSIVKLKKLSDGGRIKIVNNSIKQSLVYLGYNDSDIDDIIAHVTGNNTFDGAPHINRKSLIDAGITEDNIDIIENELDSACQLKDALKFKALSQESVSGIGLSPSDSDVNIFKQMNFTKEQYLEATQWICGHGTLEGAPHLKQSDLPIFDCAVKSGYGKRFLRWQSHVRIVSAISPFISGAISKTVNIPSDSDKKDIAAVYMMAYDGRSSAEYCPGGVKCITVYREDSKKTQPLSNPYRMDWWDPSHARVYYPRGKRRKPPKNRNLRLHEVTMTNPSGIRQKVLVKFGEYEDGSLCEVWVEVTKDNPSFYFAAKWASRAISNAIQYGMPLEDIADSFINEEGGPFGRTDHKYITSCKSIIDLVVKLAMLYYRGDITWTRRKPPIHELRVTEISSGKEDVEIGQKTADKLMVIDNCCPICSSTDIQYFPCTTCLGCGASLGGCNP